MQEPFERTALIVGQQNSLHAADFAENLILGDQVVDDQLLLARKASSSTDLPLLQFTINQISKCVMRA